MRLIICKGNYQKNKREKNEMKKNLITLMAAVAILASSTAAFADEIPMTDLTEAQEVTATQTAAPEDDEKYVMPVSEEGENISAPVSMPS